MKTKKNQAGSTKGVVAAATAKSTLIKNKGIDSALTTPRIFTYKELTKISDDNYEVLNRSIDPKKIDKKGTFVLMPIMVHHHAFGEPVTPHLRVFVIKQSDKSVCGIQDLTFEQFSTGKLVA